MAKAYSNDLRQRVLKDLLEGYTAIAVENKYSISDRTARNWLRLYRETGDCVPRPRKGKGGAEYYMKKIGFIFKKKSRNI